MAQLENQTIARMPVKENPRITLLLGGNWHSQITRTWGRKRVERHIFRTIGEDGAPKWFECNEQLAANILANIELFIVKNRIDRKKLEKLTMTISRANNGECIAAVCKSNKAPKVGVWRRIMQWLRDLGN
jgi:hypothetical protein